MGAWAEQQMMRIRERITQEFDTIGVEMVDDARESISVPVGGSGYAPIRSKPGQPPRREFGHLWASTDHSIGNGPRNDPQLTVRNDAAYARRLEYGEGKLQPRPFFAPLRATWITRIVPRLIEAIEGKR